MSFKESFRRTIWRTALSLLIVAAILAVAGWVEQRRNAGEEYAVYSAYLLEGLANDAHNWPPGEPAHVVIEDTTRAGGNWRLPGLYILDSRVRFKLLQTSTLASYLVRNLFHTRILPKFVLPYRATVVLASKSDIDLYPSPEFQRRFPRNSGFIVLSGVGFNLSRTQAVFYIDDYCGLCGGGEYVLMEKVNGSWRVRDQHSTWIS